MKYTRALGKLEVVEVPGPDTRPVHGTDPFIMGLIRNAWPEVLEEWRVSHPEEIYE